MLMAHGLDDKLKEDPKRTSRSLGMYGLLPGLGRDGMADLGYGDPET